MMNELASSITRAHPQVWLVLSIQYSMLDRTKVGNDNNHIQRYISAACSATSIMFPMLMIGPQDRLYGSRVLGHFCVTIWE
jgi:hypothetical protein